MSQPEPAVIALLPWRRVFLLIVVSDVVMTLLGLYLAHQVRYFEGLETPFVHNVPVLPLWYLLPIAALWLLTFRVFGLYERANLVSGIEEYRRIATVGLVTTLVVIVFAYVRVNPYIARGFLLVSLFAVVFLVGFGRFWIRRYVYAQAGKGRHLDRVILVGSNRHAVAVARQLTDSRSASALVVGFLSEYLPRGTAVLADRCVLGEPLELQKISDRYGITRALVVESALSWESTQAMVRLMHRRDGVCISLLPGLFDLHTTQMRPQQMGPVLALTPLPARIVGIDAVMKRTLDLLIGTAAALIAIPIMLALAAVSVARVHGFGIMRERVLGTQGQMTMWAFEGPAWARRAHLTRLPNLVHVVTGRMSLLGPRPVALSRAAAYAEAMEFLELAKPGFIGPWWLVGKREPDDIAEELAYDMHYLRNYTVWFDIHILIQVARHLVGAAPKVSLAASTSRPFATDRDASS